ncbi:hypothetical protein DFH09DRAFT_1362456 [Mycena vulgaris]|nr:hypothetical protein DFH09DRAFT_1362456 [Mycena vulgaris]
MLMVVLKLAFIASAVSRSSSAASDKHTASSHRSVVASSPSDIATASVGVPSSANALSPCASGCLSIIAANSDCLIPTDLECMCRNPIFEDDFTGCLWACSTSERQPAVNIFESYCTWGSFRTGSSGTSSAAISPCAAGCLGIVAINSVCLIPTNVTCMCTDMTFQAQYTSCLRGECFTDEVDTALALAGSQCLAASRSIPPAPPATDLSSPSIDISNAPGTSLAVLGTAALTDISPRSTSRSTPASLPVVAGKTTTSTENSRSSSAITSLPTTSLPTASPSVSHDTAPFLPSNSAAELSPISAPNTSPSTTARAGAHKGIMLNIRSTGMGIAWSALLLVL